ncbi:unnamed protein product [Lymnaea stagnalis]|uniref:Uncharacterized protein n=1 Tax=Lymnaea stagnalis TaxID=6523 RepID=A0AAV2GXI7_LYMST
MASKEKKKAERRTNSLKKIDDLPVEKTETASQLSESVDIVQSEVNTISEVDLEKQLKEKTPEPTYDEPRLTELIVESYTGELVRGLYSGEGEAWFKNGNSYKGFFTLGLMHGKGVYIWADGVVYEGDFYENQITGSGSYTWPDGSTYAGDVLNGKRHGFGTFTCANKTVAYTGDWDMGQKHGKGRMDFDVDGNSFYDGDWVSGVKHGWGVRRYPSGNMYSGMWFNNVRHGEGTMKWLDRDQIYSGQWENGIQHGSGNHIWLLKRVNRSQYPMRNMYDGDFVNGLRHGHGVFYYANGAKYDGCWRNNLKHGKGKFTFKNGRIYEGLFEKDHIVEFPDFTIDGMTSPDMSQIRTRTPVPADNVSVHSNESRNTTGPSFQLDTPALLETFPSDDIEPEVQQVLYAITRHISALRRVYGFYSMLGYEGSPDNTYIMNKLQFWRFLKDICLHHDKYSLADMDRLIGECYKKSKVELHNPYEKILQRQFVNSLVILAHLIYKKEYKKNKETGPVLEYCFSRLMTERILRFACVVKGPLYHETRRAVNALVHMDQAYEIYQAICTPRMKPPREPVLKMRSFLHFIKELGLINNDLTPAKIVQLLTSDNPNVSDGEGCFNLELEMTFLEYFEALLLCAEIFVTESVVLDPTTPRPSLKLLQELSQYSGEMTTSHAASQSAMDDEEEAATVPAESISPIPITPLRNGSSAANTVLNIKPGESPMRGSLSLHTSESNVTVNLNQSRRDSLRPDTQKTSSAIKSHSPVQEMNEDSNESDSRSGSASQPGQGLLSPYKTSTNFNTVKSPRSPYFSPYPEFESPVEADGEAVMLDDNTKKFNFWTHQIHIFFLRKFFPSAERYLAAQRSKAIIRVEHRRRQTITGPTCELREE